MTEFTCPACGHKSADIQGGEPGRQSLPAAKDIVRCDQCQARIAYGVAMPRIVVTPHPEDPRFVQVVVQDPRKDAAITQFTLTIDRQLGHGVGANLLSICKP